MLGLAAKAPVKVFISLISGEHHLRCQHLLKVYRVNTGCQGKSGLHWIPLSVTKVLRPRMVIVCVWGGVCVCARVHVCMCLGA